MDTFYRGWTEDRSGDAISPFLPPAAGGLADLFLVIWHFDQELDVGANWRMREALAESVEIDSLGRPMASEHKYLCTMGTPRWKAINDALDRRTSLHDLRASALERYRRRVSEMLNAKLVQDIGRDSLIALAPKLQPPPSALTRTPEDDRRAEEPSVPIIEEEPRENVFRKEGAAWLVVYQGKGEKNRVGHTLGMYHIRDLISKPGEELWCTQLDALLPEREASMARSEAPRIALGEAEEEGLTLPVTGDAGYTIDRATKEDLERQYDGLVRDAQIARAEGDLAEAMGAEQEADEIVKYLSASTDHRGRPRKEADTPEKTRKAVWDRLERAYRHIHEEGHSELFLHFRNSIRTGNACRYVPEPPIDWVTT